MQIFKNLEEHIEHIALVLLVTINIDKPVQSISKYVLYNRFKKI